MAGATEPNKTPTPPPPMDASSDEKVFVAVGKEYKESEATLSWALRNNPKATKIVLVHVHRPSRMIPTKGWWFLPSQLEAVHVEEYRREEIANVNQILNEHMLVCQSMEMQTEKVVAIAMENTAKALMDLILQHHITELVMGAAADKHYSKKMTAPKSKLAIAIRKKAPPFCKIWFICKGNLIATKEASVADNETSQSVTSPKASSSQNKQAGKQKYKLSSRSCYSSYQTQGYFKNLSRSSNDIPLNRESSGPSPAVALEANSESCQYVKESPDLENEEPSSSTSKGEIFEEDAHILLAENNLDSSEINDLVLDQLQQSFQEAAKLKDEIHEESQRRYRAELKLVDADRNFKLLEAKYAKEVKLRLQLEEELTSRKFERAQHGSGKDEDLTAFQVQSCCKVNELEEKLLIAQKLVDSLRKERDDAIREVEDLELEESSNIYCISPNFLEFSKMELEHATQNIDDSVKIGTWEYGSVFKGFLRHTVVAVKILHPQYSISFAKFHHKVEVISRLRHPNLVTLIGACPEVSALVYEFLPNGSLEDYLARRDNRPPLPWHARICIITELCSVLIFLHSNKPQSLIHGNLRPENILLDNNFVSKVADFGVRCLVEPKDDADYRQTDSLGSFVYLDPEFFAMGKLTTSSDVYSFGIVILRLLTGISAIRIVKEVRKALDEDKPIFDDAAGDWPVAERHELLRLGLNCCEVNRRNRPDLVKDVWEILAPMCKALSLQPSP